jgi:hypothetical protein
MSKRIMALAAAVAVACAALISQASSPASASASTRRVSPAQRTCAAFAAWERHPTPGRLRTMVRDSLTAPWRDLALDADLLYFDYRQGASTGDDVQSLRTDCLTQGNR